MHRLLCAGILSIAVFTSSFSSLPAHAGISRCTYWLSRYKTRKISPKDYDWVAPTSPLQKVSQPSAPHWAYMAAVIHAIEKVSGQSVPPEGAKLKLLSLEDLPQTPPEGMQIEGLRPDDYELLEASELDQSPHETDRVRVTVKGISRFSKIYHGGKTEITARADRKLMKDAIRLRYGSGIDAVGSDFEMEFTHVHPAYEFVNLDSQQTYRFPISPSDLLWLEFTAKRFLRTTIVLRAILPNGYAYVTRMALDRK